MATARVPPKSKKVREAHTTAITCFVFIHCFVLFILGFYKSDLNLRIRDADAPYLFLFAGLMGLEWALFFCAGALTRKEPRRGFLRSAPETRLGNYSGAL